MHRLKHVVFVIALVAFAIPLILTSIIYGGYGDVTGNSMLPTLYPDQVYFWETINDTPKIGDIVIIERDDRDYLIIHRIIQIDGEMILTKGDNNSHIDDPISRDQVIARVSLTLPISGSQMLALICLSSAYIGIYLFYSVMLFLMRLLLP